MRRAVALGAVLLVLAACSDQQEPTNNDVEPPTPATDVDIDPTPDTSTGGVQQNNNPDGTVNGVPGAATEPQD
ncbi:MAG: hypothetical protein KF723_15565 [Rhizobiaceae bacterium]|nr:hypothetical protein [Rhizobiaceae bacterium]